MRRLTLPRRKLLATLTTTPLLLASCQNLRALPRPSTPTPAEPRRVRVAWPDTHVPGPYNYYRDLLLEANSSVPEERHVRVEMVPIDLGTTPEETAARYASTLGALPAREAPDLVVTVQGRLTGALAKARGLQDLSPLLKGERWFKADDFRSNVLRTSQVRGKLLALPVMVSVELLLFDLWAFEAAGLQPPKPGWTWAECLTAALALTRPRREAESGRWGFLASPFYPTLETLAWQHGAQLVGDDGRLDLTEPGTVRAMELRASLIYVHKVAPSPEEMPPYGDTWSAWESRYGAMWPRILPVSGSTWWHRFPNVGLAEMPTAERKVCLGSVDIALGIPSSAPDVAHSLNALRGLLEAGDRTLSLLLPPRRSAEDLRKRAPLLFKEAEAAALGSALDSARFLPGDFASSPEVFELLQKEYLLPILRGEKPPERAGRDAQKLLDRIQASGSGGW